MDSLLHRHRALRSPIFIFSVVLTVLATSATTASGAREAYVTLLYGDFYVLPVRVMMRSLLANSRDVAAGTRERVVIVTGSTSDRAIQQMRDDGITVRPVPRVRSPYTGDAKYQERFVNVMTKLAIFNMTEYDRLVLVDADSLILRDMSPLFSCGVFCAVFINPCYFNSGLMMITPNETLFEDMQRVLPDTPSYDGGDQGFLNEYFPGMLDAPMFDADNPPADRPPLSRLPFSWHVDHSSFFPTFAFEFEKSNRCGQRRNIEWLGPPAGKPWLWWTYPAFDLSWTWNVYRRQLRDPYPPGLGVRRNGVLLVLLCYAALAWMARSFLPHRAAPGKIMRMLPGLCPFRNLPNRMSCFYPVVAGFLIWSVGFALCVALVPKILPPLYATVVFFHLRVVTTLAVLVCSGFMFCLGQRQSRGRGAYPVHGKALHEAFKKMLSWSIFDAAYLIVWDAFAWQFTFPTMWAKGIVIVSVIFSQFVLVAIMLSKTSLIWLRLTENEWSGGVL